MRRRTILMLVNVLVLGGLGGCQPRGTPDGPPNSGGSTVPMTDNDTAPGHIAAGWPFWPVRMRIDPLTRVIQQPAGSAGAAAEQWLVETRIGFTDADGQPAKAVGQLLIQLHENPAAAQEVVKTWNADLRDLQVNREHYDDITRTYLFRLVIAPDELTDQSQVRAMFVSVDGQRFEDRLTVTR